MGTFGIVATTAAVMLVIFALAMYIIVRRMLKASTEFDGYLEVDGTDNSQIFRLEILTDPKELRKMNEVVLKVRRRQPGAASSQG